jgi:two-component system alkaline phosphatase synthesis response regulator PhoP
MSQPTPDAASRRRVLVVDDEPAMRLLCRVNLPLAGFDVVEAVDGASALELLRSQPFDVVLLDVMMPGVNGFVVAEQLRADGAATPVVFLSARADHDDIRRGLELGAVDYVTKPFDPVAIGERLHAVVSAVADGGADALRAQRLRELDA